MRALGIVYRDLLFCGVCAHANVPEVSIALSVHYYTNTSQPVTSTQEPSSNITSPTSSVMSTVCALDSSDRLEDASASVTNALVGKDFLSNGPKENEEAHQCDTEEMDNFEVESRRFRESQKFLPDIFGEENPHYSLDWSSFTNSCVDHEMLGRIWMSCERASDLAGYNTYLRLGWQDNKDVFTIVNEEARLAFLRTLPNPEEITFSILPHRYAAVFIKNMTKEADEYAEEVTIQLMTMNQK